MKKGFFVKKDKNRQNEEEKYQFMREQIKPQKRQLVVKFLKKVGYTAVLALIFGTLTGLAFVAVNRIFPSAEAGVAGVAPDLQGSSVTATGNQNEISDIGGNSSESEGAMDSSSLNLESYKELSRQIADIGNQCNPYIVFVSNEQENSQWFNGDGNQQVLQCGVIFRSTMKEYYILTSTQTLSGTKMAEVTFSDTTRTTAEVLGRDNDLGIAVLKVNKDNLSKSTTSIIQVATFGGSSNLILGTPIIALGCPDSLKYSVKWGYIVNDGLKARVTDGETALYSSDINFCSSGNAIIVNLKGKVIGITVSSFLNDIGGSGFSFLGASEIYGLVENLAHGREKAYLGISGCNVSEDKTGELGLSSGVYVMNVLSRSPAYAGDIRVTDIIVGIDDQVIENLQQLHEFLIMQAAEKKVTVIVKRKCGNKMIEKNLKITLG